MLILLTPSKSMNLTRKIFFDVPFETPLFLDKSVQIKNTIASMSETKLAKLMSISAPLAKQTKERYEEWTKEHFLQNSRPAIWAYTGDVYKGLRAETFDKTDTDWAQQHLLIPSGLYGAVRPYDLVQAYRLEMKTKLKVGKTKDLYEFWGKTAANYAEERSGGVICNLSSEEYARVITKPLSKSVKVITPIFLDTKADGTIQSVPIYSKIMRGVVVHWIVKNKIDRLSRLNEFAEQGYEYNKELSISYKTPTFLRKIMRVIRF